MTSPKKNPNPLDLISLFSGAGGADLGFRQEGFRIVWANDHDKWACETYRKNLGPIEQCDIADVDFKKVPDAGIIIGGFPCQDFSIIWKATPSKRPGLGTERGNLYRHFLRAVVEKKPYAFMAENVRGLMTANGGRALKRIRDDFSNAGYTLSIKLVNFADYGVPQLRQRVIIVGLRNDLGKTFAFPEPTHNKSNYVTAEKAFEGIEKVLANNEKMRVSPKVEEMLRRIPEGRNYSAIPRDSEYFVEGKGLSLIYRRLEHNKPSMTIVAAGGGGTWGYHYAEPRPLTNRERARLQTFPDDFVFCGNIGEVRRQIGNAVPPLGIRPIARALKEILLGASGEQTSMFSYITTPAHKRAKGTHNADS